jgi:hypothetical protein
MPEANAACASCGAPFYASPGHQAQGWGKYCSRGCAGSANAGERSARWTGGKVELRCLGCGRLFSVRRSEANAGRKYCSRDCRRNHKNAALTCLGCGKEFTIPMAWARKGGIRFCSRECRAILFASRSNRVCESCGKAFFVKESDLLREDKIGVGRFCSMECKARHMSGRGRGRYRGYGGKREDLGGQYFRSTWEANWARYLNWLVSVGDVLAWEFEPETFEFPIKRGSKFYTPDFRVTNKDGTVEYHEIKGYMDQKSATKIRRFQKYYPEHRLIVVEADSYYAVARQIGHALEGWERRNGMPG